VKTCLCGVAGLTVTTTCDKCLEPLCRKCATIVVPKLVNGDIKINHVQCMSKEFQRNYYENEVNKNE